MPDNSRCYNRHRNLLLSRQLEGTHDTGIFTIITWYSWIDSHGFSAGSFFLGCWHIVPLKSWLVWMVEIIQVLTYGDFHRFCLMNIHELIAVFSNLSTGEVGLLLISNNIYYFDPLNFSVFKSLTMFAHFWHCLMTCFASSFAFVLHLFPSWRKLPSS